MRKAILTGGFVALSILVLAGAPAQAQVEFFTNNGFETGDFTGWTLTDLTAPLCFQAVQPAGSVPCWGFFTTSPAEGAFSATNGFDGDGPGVIELCQEVAIPAGTSDLFLSWDMRLAWDMTFGGALDRTVDVTVRPAGGGAPLFSETVFTATQGTTNFDTGHLLLTSSDLSAFAGATSRFCITEVIPEAFSGPGDVEIDDVHLIGTTTGACCLNGPNTETECAVLPRDECERDHHIFLGGDCTADIDCVALYVTLDTVSAKAVADGVLISWTTQAEIDTVGFRVVRESGDREKRWDVVSPVIPAIGGGLTGASYEFLDNSLESSGAVHYYLQDIDIYGRETSHGPFQVQRSRLAEPTEADDEPDTRRSNTRRRR